MPMVDAERIKRLRSRHVRVAMLCKAGKSTSYLCSAQGPDGYPMYQNGRECTS